MRMCRRCHNAPVNSPHEWYCPSCREEAKKEAYQKSLIAKKAKRIGPRFKYDKTEPKPMPKDIQKLSPASQRWATMSWQDLTKELDKFGLTYKESQIMAKNNTLPKTFGQKKRGRKKCQQ